MIDYSDFTKVDLRAGRIIKVEEFPRARTPSYKVLVDFGPEIGERWSSMQAAREYRPEDLLDTFVVGVVNMPGRNIAGFMSQVLILGVPAADGGLSLLRPDRGAQLGGRVY
ncbi:MULTISPECIES: tRNA-binding protein [unclassified Micromonospora]|uniref:tRNA-binding protein n=1 Tax=unclassified Micromonospora TaxID=2617518 RepID=UPI003A88DF80